MSEVRDDLLAALPDVVATQVAARIPDLAECRGIAGRFSVGELRKQSIRHPAVLIAHLGARQEQDWTGPHHGFLLDMAAFVITKDRLGLPRDAAAANIGQVLLSMIPDNSWGESALGQARAVRLQSLVTPETRDAATSLWAVTWSQPAVVQGYTTPEPLAIELYLGQAPEVGAEHEDDYTEIGGTS